MEIKSLAFHTLFCTSQTPRCQGHLNKKALPNSSGVERALGVCRGWGSYLILYVRGTIEGFQVEKWYTFERALERLISVIELVFDSAYVWFLDIHTTWNKIMKIHYEDLSGLFFFFFSELSCLSPPCLLLQWVGCLHQRRLLEFGGKAPSIFDEVNTDLQISILPPYTFQKQAWLSI